MSRPQIIGSSVTAAMPRSISAAPRPWAAEAMMTMSVTSTQNCGERNE